MEGYRETGFNTAKFEALELAKSINVEAEFKIPRYRKKKKLFDYEGGENHKPDPEDDLRCSYFLELMDSAIGSIKKRFEQTLNFNETFGFLYTIGKLRSVTEEDIRKHCKDLALQLQVGDENDVCPSGLFDELLVCWNIVDESATPIEVLCN